MISRFTRLALLLLAAYTTATVQAGILCDTPDLYDEHPVLCHMLDRLSHDDGGKELAKEITDWAEQHRLLVGNDWDFPDEVDSFSQSAFSQQPNQLPIVFAHGMGDSCFNNGMRHIVDFTSDLLNGAYATCIPTGKTQHEDTTNGYFLNMDASVDVFAESVKQNPQLAKGFHAIGFSQGNNVIRGYITRFNDPPVDTFLSINGVNAGVGAVPHCRPKKLGDSSSFSTTSICDLLMEQASKRAYNDFTQERSFQANYWRDARPVEKEAYQKYSQLARWNNEGGFNQTFKDNWGKTKKFVWVMATEDGMVWPKEGEHWGAPDPEDPFNRVLPMNQTEWYIQDLFGLKTAQEAGKNYFESFEGDHLAFTMEDFTGWVQTYMAEKDDTFSVITS